MAQSQQGQSQGTGASNIVYDLVSIQYHALKGAQVYDQYCRDAQSTGNQEIVQFIQRVQQEDRERALQVHDLLARFAQTTGGTIDLTGGQNGAQSGSQSGLQGGKAMAGTGAGAGKIRT